MSDLPAGTVTFLFSDVEGSTRLIEKHAARAGVALARHHEIFEAAILAAGGAIFETVGDAVYASFSRPIGAVQAAVDVQRALADEPWDTPEPVRARIAIHTGDVESRGRHYFGPALFRCARLMAIGHGGQVLVSSMTAGLLGSELPPGVSLKDMGVHRLKDLGAPEQVYQVIAVGLRQTFPALISLDSHPNNLPQQLTSFFGRQAELGEIDQALETARLVTLTGPGGTGKTRLALQAAADRVHRHADGVFLVELAPTTDPELVLPAIATTLGIQAEPTHPLIDVLVEYIGSRDMLLVLDNFEQVLGAARDVAIVLANSTRLRVLATSRAPLHVRGERELRIAPLAIDDGDTSGPAVQLFMARATDLRPDLAGADAATVEAVRGICEMLDGLPLAIELAAARVRVFDPPELLHRIDQRLSLLTDGPVDAPERHRSLHAALAWSVNLLAASERGLLADCSVFTGGWSEEAAASVAGPAEWTLNALSSLVENSLVTRLSSPHGTRFTMLEAVRDYASTLLNAETANAVRRRHAEFYLSLAERLDPQLFGREGRAVRNRYAVELPNMEAAFRWAIGTRASDIALRFAWALRWAWDLSVGRQRDGLSLSTAAVELSDERSLARARAIHATGNQTWFLNDVSHARDHWELALAIYREVGDEEGIAGVLNNLAEYEQDPDARVEMYRESLAIMARRGNVRAQTNTLHNLGVVELTRGRLDASREFVEQGVELARQSGDDIHVARGGVTLAEICLHRGELDSAAAFIGQAQRAARAAGEDFLVATASVIEAQVEHARGDDRRAVELLSNVLATRDLGDYRRAAIAYVAEALAPILARHGHTLEAARALGMADSWMVPMAWRVNAPLRASTIARLVEASQVSPTEDAFRAARAAGEALEPDVQEEEIPQLLAQLASSLTAATSDVRPPASARSS